MNGNKPSALDILSCRKLVELYYGVPMVVSLIENVFGVGATPPVRILQQDPRRIRYEIVLANPDPAADTVTIGSLAATQAGTALKYEVPPGGSVTVDRSFLSDLEGVTLEVWATSVSGDTFITTRETFLTPSAIDEIPDV